MDEWVWRNGGMILTGENWSTGIKTLYSVGGRWMNEYWTMVEWFWQGSLNCSKDHCAVDTLSTEKSRVTDWDVARVSAVSGRLLTNRAITCHLSHNHHYSLLTIGITTLFLWVKAAGGIQLTTQIHLWPRLRISGSVPLLPLLTFRTCIWLTLLLAENC